MLPTLLTEPLHILRTSKSPVTCFMHICVSSAFWSDWLRIAWTGRKLSTECITNEALRLYFLADMVSNWNILSCIINSYAWLLILELLWSQSHLHQVWYMCAFKEIVQNRSKHMHAYTRSKTSGFDWASLHQLCVPGFGRENSMGTSF